jgi:transcriptional regulator with XRE-family HTH domain
MRETFNALACSTMPGNRIALLLFVRCFRNITATGIQQESYNVNTEVGIL